MVNLTDEEKRMLDGELGPVPQKCMAYLVEECEVSGADHLVDLDGTGDFHTPWTSMSPHYEFSLEELRDLVESGAHFKIPTFANKTPFPFPHAHAGLAGLRYESAQRAGVSRKSHAKRIPQFI
jgi:predicted aconitase